MFFYLDFCHGAEILAFCRQQYVFLSCDDFPSAVRMTRTRNINSTSGWLGLNATQLQAMLRESERELASIYQQTAMHCFLSIAC